MTITFRLFLLLTISFCFCNCSSNNKKNKVVVEIKPPEFADNSKTVDSLKKVYNCESIDYENWADKDATDSCLTVCLINSSKIPSEKNVDEEPNELKTIAMAIKKSLARPKTYKSFYIIFVTKNNINGIESKVHSAGMEIASAQL